MFLKNFIKRDIQSKNILNVFVYYCLKIWKLLRHAKVYAFLNKKKANPSKYITD